MTHEQKLQVRDALMRYMASFDTQALAAATLQGISPSIISQVKNDNWDMIGERMWYHIARQVGFYCGEWLRADTSAYLLLNILFGDAQHYAMAYGIAIGNGLGKTFAANHYMREHDNVFYLACKPEHDRKSFIASLAQAVGIKPSGTIPNMINSFTHTIMATDEPLLIIDDAHKLKDKVMQLWVSIANALTGATGIIMMGAENLRQKITDGVQLKTTGYDKIYNTFGNRFITLTKLSPKDIQTICRTNGLDDESAIAAVAEECEGNLHNIATVVDRYRQMKIAA